MGAAMFRRMDASYAGIWRGPLRALRRAVGRPPSTWPSAPGAYLVGDPSAPVAVCTLTSTELMRPLATVPGVAIAGRVYTCNLGIEKIVVNVCANPRIKALVVCGRESPLFQPGQGLRALVAHGVRADMQIVGGEGYLPVLSGIGADVVDQFRRQVTFIDRTGTTDVATLAPEIERLARRLDAMDAGREPTVAIAATGSQTGTDEDRFVEIEPGGKREPLAYDPKGHFVITVARDERLIVARHYTQSMAPAHIMRGRSGEGMVLGLIREGLVTQLSHAAYLGAEFAKAEAALRLHLEFEQDQPLRKLGV
jgi:tetrahydromethanopterin S-methyltransferase subunit A